MDLSALASLPWTYGVVATVVVLSLYVILSSFTSYWRLRHIPGPPLACVSQLWLFQVTAQGRLYLAAEDAFKRYGSPFRIGPNMILTDDPVLQRHMNAPRSPFRRGHWYKGMKFDPRIDNLLSERDEVRHTELRAKLMPGYTAKEVPNLESDIDARVTDLIHLIKREYAEKNRVMDFAKLAQYFTLDSLTTIAFGYPFGFVTKNEDLYDYNKTSTAFFPVMELGTNIPLVHRVLSSKLVHAIAGPKAEDKLGLGAIIGIAHTIVAERFNSDAKAPKDMLASFISHGLTQEEAESESLLTILAGADSTATCIRCTLLYLLTHPVAFAKLREEIDKAVNSGNVTLPVIKYSVGVRMPYLQACIKEGLRLWQPLNGIQTKDSPPEGVTVNGTYIPGGTQVGWSSHSMMKRQDIFGEDADLFRPERWLDGDPATIKGYERAWEITFGAGRFSCLGKSIALMELTKVLVELLHNFDLGIVDPISPMQTSCSQIHIQRNMNLQVSQRNK